MIDDKSAIKSLQDFDKKGKDAANGAEKINAAFSKIGAAVVSAFSVAAVVAFSKSIVETTAKLNAMEAQFEQVFKSDKGIAMANISKQADTLGIHVDRLTMSWNKFGAQTKGAGMEAKQSLEATEKATRLAADAAAFYDVSLENSSASLASFMKGNFAAGDAIGVFTNAKQMDVKANEQYSKSWADLTEAERQYLLLDTVEKTYKMNGAMGQAIRESQNWENVTANLKSTWERFLKDIGTPVLDAATDAVIALTDGIQWLNDKVNEANEWLAENKALVEGLEIVFGTLTAAVIAYNISLHASAIASGIATAAAATMTLVTGGLSAVMGFLTSTVTIAVVSIGLLVFAVYALVNGWDDAEKKLKKSVDSVKDSYVDLAKTKITTPQVTVPDIQAKANVKWNAKGAIFDKPTIFSTPYGLQGVGDATSPEVVAPLNSLKEMLGIDMKGERTQTINIETLNVLDKGDEANTLAQLEFLMNF